MFNFIKKKYILTVFNLYLFARGNLLRRYIMTTSLDSSSLG